MDRHLPSLFTQPGLPGQALSIVTPEDSYDFFEFTHFLPAREAHTIRRILGRTLALEEKKKKKTKEKKKSDDIRRRALVFPP